MTKETNDSEVAVDTTQRSEQPDLDLPRLTVQHEDASQAEELDIEGLSPAGNLTTVRSSSSEQSMAGDTDPNRPQGPELQKTRSQDAPFHPDGNRNVVQSEHDGFATNASVADDGRVDIQIKQRTRRLSDVLAPLLRRQQSAVDHEAAPAEPYIPPSLGGDGQIPPPPPMNVVIQVVGSRGDVQPFVALGQVLQRTYGHRIRLATHPVFKDFVTENGLEFFSIGGDPAQLMAFMVKNPGLMPGFDSLRSGDVGKRRKEVGEYLKGCWRSCYEPGDGLGPEALNIPVEDWAAQQVDDPGSRPFVADCIIANPPSFAHVHCAEKLGIPLHIMFTMPYSPTQAFPHPLANIQLSNADPHLTNYVSYALIDMLTWQGLGDIINAFRQRSLNLEPVSLLWAPGMLQRLKIPHTYCWSPALIPKPRDWARHISIAGFFFLNLASGYTPAPELKAFLEAGPPPVYIGFGSIVLDDPNAMTRLIFDAVRLTGQRILLSKGWGGMGADELGIPDGVFMLGNVPHDWLFKQVSCVVHHGGAGTTAAGITAGRPTVVVPFFGDQPFWGSMVARAGAGPEPIPHKELTSEKLAEAIQFCLRPESQERAHELAAKIAQEKGSDVGAQHFHQMLDVDKLRCALAPGRTAAWRIRRTEVRISALAACVLAKEGLLDFKELKLFRSREYETDDGPWDPITGGATALVGTMGTMMLGVADFPIETLKALKIHPSATQKTETPEIPGSFDRLDVNSSTATTSDISRPDSPSEKSNESGTDTPPSSQSSQTAHAAFNLQESLEKLQASNGIPEPMARANSMADALRGQLGNSKSRTLSASDSGTRKRSLSENMETAIGTAKGVHKIVSAGIKSPMEFTMAVAKGFHNAPKLYGDETVRTPDAVTDFASGVRVASKEFGYGIYDGITGLVTQPVHGAKKEGAAGFVKGIGKGIGGVVLKTSGAAFSIPGYTMKGLYKEIQAIFGSSVLNYIIAARTAQGFDEWHRSTEEQRQSIINNWNVLKKNLKKKKNPDEVVKELIEEQKKKGIILTHDIMNTRELKRRSFSRTGSASRSRVNSTIHSPRQSDELITTSGTHESRAEHASPAHGVRESQMDNPTEQSDPNTHNHDGEHEAELQLALQASLADAQRSRPGAHNDTQDDDPELQRAITISRAEMQTQRERHGDLDDDDDFRNALEASMAEQHRQSSSRQRSDTQDTQEEDEDLHNALRASMADAQLRDAAKRADDEQFKRALAQSLAEHQSQGGHD